jgi:LysM repeat protein
MRLASWSIAVLLLVAPVSFSQAIRQPIPLQTTSGTGFTSAPYSGKETTVKVQTLTDGTKTTTTSVEYIWRDAEGRTRRDLIRNDNSGAQYRSVIITDPVGGIYLKWEEGNPSARQIVSIWPVARAQRVTAPPNAVPPTPPNPAAMVSTPDYRREILTPQYINGVYSEGMRTVHTFRLEGEASNRVIEVTNEMWISPDLRIIVRHIHDDPRTGKEDTEVTDIVRGDPDPTLFQPPEGYDVMDHRGQNPQ